MELVIGIILAVIVMLIVASWWSEGYIEAGEAVVLFAVFGGLLFGLFVAPTPTARALVLVPIVASTVWGAYLVKAGSMKSYLREKIHEYEKAIDFDPRNFAARVKLAQALNQLGECERAIMEMKMAIDLAPGASYKERQELRLWEEDQRLKQTGFVTCSHCATRNERGHVKCIRCGTPLPYAPPKKQKGESRRAFAVIITGLAMAAASFAFLPAMLALIPACCGLFAALIWTILQKT